MGKRELAALLNVSSWCIVMVERLFLAVPWGCLLFVIVVFPDHTHLLFWVEDNTWGHFIDCGHVYREEMTLKRYFYCLARAAILFRGAEFGRGHI